MAVCRWGNTAHLTIASRLEKKSGVRAIGGICDSGSSRLGVGIRRAAPHKQLHRGNGRSTIFKCVPPLAPRARHRFA